MLQIDLGPAATGPVAVAGEYEPADELFAGLDFAVVSPVRFAGRLTESGSSQYYLQGRLEAGVTASCRRCLAEVPVTVAAEVRALFTDDERADDPAAYFIATGARAVELDEVIREQLILAVPDYPLCREECLGLCPRCGKDLNEGPCGCRSAPDPRWSALEPLKHQRPRDEE
jgi:uncharacterized protein